MKVMITGITGVIGTAVADLIEDDHAVFGVDIRKSENIPP